MLGFPTLDPHAHQYGDVTTFWLLPQPLYTYYDPFICPKLNLCFPDILDKQAFLVYKDFLKGSVRTL